jgi:hypothetical protein
MLIINNRTELLKNAKINKNLNKCYHCDLIYDSYNLSYFNLDKNQNAICKYCLMIDTVKYNNINNLILCYSKLEQNEIIKRSINYIREYNKTPLIYQIDKNVKNLNISLLEYIDIVENLNKTNIAKIPKKILNNYKIFFSNEFVLDETNNYSFDSDQDEEINQEDIENDINNEECIKDKKIKTHKMTEKEITFIDQYYKEICLV